MKKILTAALMIAALAAPPQVHAQDAGEAALEQELRDMVVQPTEAERDREAVQQFLERGDVQEIADDRGIDTERLQDRVATLDGEQTSQLAERIRDLEDDLEQVGGDTFVITSSTIIIILLVIILIVVA